MLHIHNFLSSIIRSESKEEVWSWESNAALSEPESEVWHRNQDLMVYYWSEGPGLHGVKACLAKWGLAAEWATMAGIHWADDGIATRTYFCSMLLFYWKLSFLYLAGRGRRLILPAGLNPNCSVMCIRMMKCKLKIWRW